MQVTRPNGPVVGQDGRVVDPPSLTLSDFPVHRPVTTRWSDNDMYGHLNNAVYYELFDSAINGWQVEHVAIDPLTEPTVRAAVQRATFEVLVGFQLDQDQLSYNATR